VCESNKGVGDLFAEMIPEWAISQNNLNCDCLERREKMNKFGPKWVRQNKDDLVSRIIEDRDALSDRLKMLPTFTLKIAVSKMLLDACNKFDLQIAVSNSEDCRH